MSEVATYSLRVGINGTKINPFHKYGLKMNPFPQLGKAEWAWAERKLAQMAADPVPNANWIRHHLAGFPAEFVDLCCAQYRRGKYVRFRVEWTENE
jgi:hypothetical protein